MVRAAGSAGFGSREAWRRAGREERRRATERTAGIVRRDFLERSRGSLAALLLLLPPRCRHDLLPAVPRAGRQGPRARAVCNPRADGPRCAWGSRNGRRGGDHSRPAVPRRGGSGGRRAAVAAAGGRASAVDPRLQLLRPSCTGLPAPTPLPLPRPAGDSVEEAPKPRTFKPEGGEQPAAEDMDQGAAALSCCRPVPARLPAAPPPSCSSWPGAPPHAAPVLACAAVAARAAGTGSDRVRTPTSAGREATDSSEPVGGPL